MLIKIYGRAIHGVSKQTIILENLEQNFDKTIRGMILSSLL